MSNNTFARSARTLAEPFVVPYYYLTLLGVGTLVLWLVEWGINLAGGGTINTFVTMATSVAVLIFGMQPLYVAYSGQIGAILSVVKLKDPRQGVSNAVRTHFKVVMWIVFANILVGLMLSTVTFGAPLWVTVFPNLLLLVFAAIIFGYLFDMNGVDLKKKFVAGFLILILGVLAWNWVGPENREAAASRFNDGTEAIAGIASSSAGSVGCSDHVPLVEHGMRITVAVGCPVKVDQMNMRNGTDFKLVDPALRAVTGRQQLVTMDPDNNNRFVTFQANAEGLRRYGRTAVEVELYRAGTGDAEVARRYGVVTPNIDLNPAR